MPIDKWMPDFSSLEDAYGVPFEKRAPVTQAAENESRPRLVSRMPQTYVDDVAKTLPISKEDSNYKMEYTELRKPTQSVARVKESFTPNYAYAPPGFDDTQMHAQIQRILKLVEQNKTGYQTSTSQDMLLYIFTGVLFLFTFDSFVTLGRQMR